MYTLNTTGVHGIAQPLPFNTTQITSPYNGNNPKYGDPCHTLASTDHPPAIAQPLAVDCYNQTVNEKTSQTIGSSASDVNHYGAVLHSMAIRRLTPTECERLQGFPDSWTQIPYRNKPADLCPDGPRYKACGNSMAVPVMRWIGERINLAENLLNQNK
jgi:DNA (cytosine-5)-methyltransferase 1